MDFSGYLWQFIVDFCIISGLFDGLEFKVSGETVEIQVLNSNV